MAYRNFSHAPLEHDIKKEELDGPWLDHKEALMHTPRSMCSIHHVVELLPGIWKLDQTLARSSNGNTRGKERACPTCLQIAREAFQQQFPALYSSATALTRQSA